MTTKEQLVEQHIREYESRQKHVDELLAQASKVVETSPAQGAQHEVALYQNQHDNLVEHTEQMKKMPLDHWREETIQSAGPMAIWDVIAQKLEDLVERVEK